MHVRELQPGDEIIGYMRLGLALETAITGKGEPFRKVPRKTKKASSNALTRFTGVVLNNDIVNDVLTVQATRMDSNRLAFNNVFDPAYVASIHYSAFSKLQVLSKTSQLSDKELYTSRPTSTEGLGTSRKPSRILNNVKLR